MKLNKFCLLCLASVCGLLQVSAQVRPGTGGGAGGSAPYSAPRSPAPNGDGNAASGNQNGSVSGTTANGTANGDTSGNVNGNASTGIDPNVSRNSFGRITNNLRGAQNPDGSNLAINQRQNFQRTNQFGVVTNGFGFSSNRFAFNTNRFGFGTNEFGVVTNRFGAITNQVGRFGFGGTNRTMTPTSNRGTNRFYGTNTFQGNQSTGLRDQAFTSTDQALLSHIQQTIDPKLGITSVDNSPIHFVVQQNNVTLMGYANSPEQKALIVSIVKGVPGVVSVQDNLVIGAALGTPGFNNNASGTIGVSARSIDGVPSQISLNPSGIDSNSVLERRLSIGTNGVTGAAPIGEPPVAPVPPAPNSAPQQ